MRHYIPRQYVPGTTTLLLTETRKMPSASWSLPARAACPFAFYGEGSICGDCYATKGSYTQYPTVMKAQNTRYGWVRDCLKTEVGINEFVATMVRAIRSHTDRQTGQKYFRVHDSGDLFSPAYTWAWVRIVQALPEVRFWFPTRSWRPLTMTKIAPDVKVGWELALMALSAEDNVTVRPSALLFNAPAPRIPGLAAGSTAAEAGYSCPASKQNNECGECRACWDSPELAISYKAH
jgi:hypothetical protein